MIEQSAELNSKSSGTCMTTSGRTRNTCSHRRQRAQEPVHDENCKSESDDRVYPTASDHPMPLKTWNRNARDLATWTGANVANRVDAYGGYYRYRSEVRRVTRKMTDGRWMPLRLALQRHFCATMPEQIVGLHTTSPQNTSRWLVIDIDAHHGEDPTQNLRIAISIADRLSEFGVAAHIFDSDGRGGIHIWTVFDRPIPTERVFALGRRVTADYPVEIFPKQPRVAPGGFGNWIRLPGMHHSRPHWSRYWCESRWLDAEETVHAILAIEPSPVELLPPIVRVRRIPTSRRLSSQDFSLNFTDSPETLCGWLEQHGVVVKEQRHLSGGAVALVLGRCPINPDHGEAPGDTSVAVIWRPSGVGFHCFHRRCNQVGWRVLRARIDPNYPSPSGFSARHQDVPLASGGQPKVNGSASIRRVRVLDRPNKNCTGEHRE